MDFTRATALTPDVAESIWDAFDYHPWSEAQKDQGKRVKDALVTAVGAIIANVPPCPDRSAAIRKLREAQMDANSSITHSGKY